MTQIYETFSWSFQKGSKTHDPGRKKGQRGMGAFTECVENFNLFVLTQGPAQSTGSLLRWCGRAKVPPLNWNKWYNQTGQINEKEKKMKTKTRCGERVRARCDFSGKGSPMLQLRKY